MGQRTAFLLILLAVNAFALDPRKSPTQYSRTIWTQERGLPHDTIRTITQTSDGYLWLGTDEGLARFDGYDFAVYNKVNGDLPDNSITALAAAADGSLWIGTSNGLTQYRDGHFTTFTVKQGLPDPAITALYAGHDGTLWVVAGLYLSRYQNGRFTNYRPDIDIPMSAARAVCEDRNFDLWVAGFSGVVKRTGNTFQTVVSARELDGLVILAMMSDRAGDLWIGGSAGIIRRTQAGVLRKYGVREGLPDPVVRAIWSDRDGNLWAGTNNGIARLEGNRFVATGQEDPDVGDVVRCLFEDREGDLWIGANGGLSRWRNDIFMVYGKPERLPSDAPNTVFQDSRGRIWVGFNDVGLLEFKGTASRLLTTREGMPDNEVFQIREANNGDLLISTRTGMARLSGGSKFVNYSPPDSLRRTAVFDAIDDKKGDIWLATPGGLGVLRDGKLTTVVPGGPLLIDFVVTLCETRDGAIWAGTYGKGLWRVKDGQLTQYTTANGLASDQIRSLYEDAEGTLWIGTFGGGLNALREGQFLHYGARDGLLSDNIGNVADDGNALWLSTTRGISRVWKRDLDAFNSGKLRHLEPQHYGVEDGLRSAQCAPAYPIAGGGTRTSDGRLWFTTGRGLAVLNPDTHKPPAVAPVAHLVQMTANGNPVNLDGSARLDPDDDRVQIRYTGIHLSAPERVQYFYRLDGLDHDWVSASSRRLINFNSLHYGRYRFHMRAELPGGAGSEQSFDFEILPHFWDTAWFRALCVAALLAAGFAVYQLRLQQIRSRFALVLEERARLAREIHDTLAQGFVGISSQLDAVALSMPDQSTPARSYLDMARRMARHSLTEARRSVMDLRSAQLEGQDLAAAIESGARLWTAGSGVDVDFEVTGTAAQLPEETEQHLLRIAQEAITNALKHAKATKIHVKLHRENQDLRLHVGDNGRGFDQQDVFSSRAGHFGLIGMRERAERLGGKLKLASNPGQGTEVEVTVPLS
ncbi:MAG: two-component regulator propeller domain-containing protein [Candidatus Solibacter sp.]